MDKLFDTVLELSWQAGLIALALERKEKQHG